MKKVFAFLTAMNLLLIPAFAELTEGEIRGMMTPLKSQYRYLSPVDGLAALRSTLTKIRFNGYFGPEIEGVKCYEQNKRSNPHKDCPLNHRSSLVQHLFPSPAGEPLVPNNYLVVGDGHTVGYDDQIRNFSTGTIGHIVRVVTELREEAAAGHSQDEQDQVNKLALAIYASHYPNDYKSLFEEVRGREAGKTAQKKQRKETQQQEGSEQRQIGIMNSRIKELTQASKTRDLSEGEKAELLQKQGFVQGLLSKLRAEKQQSSSVLENLDDLMIQALSSSQDFQKCVNFATVVVKALNESLTSPHEYPYYIVEQSLLAFAWKKANEKNDFKAFFEALGPRIIDQQFVDSQGQFVPPPEWSTNFTKQDYDEFKEGFQDGLPTPTVADRVYQDPELAFYVTFAFDTYDQPYPRLLGFTTAYFPSFKPGEKEALSPVQLQNELVRRGYPDCGEMSIRNFLNVILYDVSIQTFDVDLLKAIAPKASLQLADFFREQKSGNMESLRDQWSDLVSDLNKSRTEGQIPIQYSKQKQQGECDITPGMANLLAVVCYLLNDEELNKFNTRGAVPIPEERSAKILTRLCEMVNAAMKSMGRNFDLSWQVRDGKQKIPSDTNTTIDFLVNGQVQFEWSFTSNHFDFKVIHSKSVVDWRKSFTRSYYGIVQQQSGETMSSLEILLPFYVRSANALPFLQNASPALQQRWFSGLIYSGSLSDVEGVIQAIPLVITYDRDSHGQLNEGSSLVNLMKNRWINALPDDPNAYAALFNALYSVQKLLDPNLTARMDEIKEMMIKDRESQKKYLEIAGQKGFLSIVEILGDENPKILNEWLGFEQQEKIIHIAAKNGYLDIMKYLFEKDPSLFQEARVKAAYGYTPLHFAARGGHLDIVMYLFEKAPDLFRGDLVKTRTGFTPLHSAAQSGDLKVVQYLFEKAPHLFREDSFLKTRNRTTPLHSAVQYGYLNIVEYLLDKNPKLLKRELVKDQFGNSPLHAAASYGHLPIVMYFVQKYPELLEGDVVRGAQGETPLHSAASYNRLSVVKYFVEEVPQLLANDLLKNENGSTPLHFAVMKENLNMIEYLAEKAPKLFERDFLKNNGGDTFLHLAASRNSLTIVKYFVEKMPELLTEDLLKNNKGDTPLHLAASFGIVDNVKYLIEQSPESIFMTNNEGNKPVEETQDAKVKEILEAAEKKILEEQ